MKIPLKLNYSQCPNLSSKMSLPILTVLLTNKIVWKGWTDGYIFNGNLQLMIFHRPETGSVLFEPFRK